METWKVVHNSKQLDWVDSVSSRQFCQSKDASQQSYGLYKLEWVGPDASGQFKGLLKLF